MHRVHRRLIGPVSRRMPPGRMKQHSAIIYSMHGKQVGADASRSRRFIVHAHCEALPTLVSHASHT